MTANAAAEVVDERIECRICGEKTHAIQSHLAEKHKELTIEQYKETYPDAPIFSPIVEAKLALKAKSDEANKKETVMPCGTEKGVGAFHSAFGFRASGEAVSTKNNAPIPINIITKTPFADMIPVIDNGYVMDVAITKRAMLGVEYKMPVYLWGHKGTGKTTLAEQLAARTGRPTIRIQHTANTEESHIVGQTLANENGTYFSPGPLALAMKHGWVYLADEYDFAFPQVLGVYQPVLEGGALVIKEATPEWRVIKPHPEFRFVATGNTNGSGDETGLYQGTNMQNSANYSRFGVCLEVKYMPKEAEVAMLRNRCGISEKDALLVVKWATDVRSAFDKGDVSDTVSPRELINGVKLGLALMDYREGMKLAFINKLPKISQEAVDKFSQRYFG